MANNVCALGETECPKSYVGGSMECVVNAVREYTLKFTTSRLDSSKPRRWVECIGN